MTNPKPRKPIEILLVDDDFGEPAPAFPEKYGCLEHRDQPYRFHYESARDGKSFSVRAAIQAVQRVENLAALFLDIKFGAEHDRLGLRILEAARERFPLLPIIMLTSLDSDVDAIEEAMELGANEYLIKSPSVEELEQILRIYTQSGTYESEHGIWGNAPSVRSMRAQIARVAIAGSVTVLVNGETGTGKELVARGIHRLGPRRGKPFVAKNCSHSETQLLDAELFGQDKGSFTGAEAAEGLVEQADGGVLFLDEIADMPIALQGKLLRLLESRTYRRVGAATERKTDFQLVCATNHLLEDLVQSGRLLRDLYYRINVITITAPPLRERRDDIPLLAELFLRRFRQGPGSIYPAKGFTRGALDSLSSEQLRWPGNARELRNIVESCATMTRMTEIDTTDLPPSLLRNPLHSDFDSNQDASVDGSLDAAARIKLSDSRIDLPLELGKIELSTIRESLARTKGNKAQVMRMLYPGQPTHYYYRIIYRVIKKCPRLLEHFPEFEEDFRREQQSRSSSAKGS